MPKRFFILAVGLLVMGQSCTISFGNPEPLDGGVYRSDNHAESWKQKVFVRTEKKKTITIAGLTTLNFTFRPGDPKTLYLGSRGQGIWYSRDQGEKWTQSSLRSGSYSCLAFDPDNPDIMYTGAGTSVLKSLDAGKTWKTIYQESQAANTISCVAVDPIEGRYVWTVTDAGKFILSNDYGETWTLMQTLAKIKVLNMFVESDGSGRLVVITNRGIYTVTGRGTGVESLTSALKDTELSGATSIHDVSILDGPQPRWYLSTKYGPLLSLDRGQSWTAIPTLINPGKSTITNVVANPENPAEIFLTVGRRLHHTTDAGQSWSVSTLPTSLQPVELSFNPDNPDILYFATFQPEEK